MHSDRSASWFPRFRTLIFLLLGSALLLTVIIVYLQTSHGFRHVIVPLARTVVPGDLQIENGNLTFPGTVELTGFSYREPEAGLAVLIDHLQLRTAWVPLIRDGMLFIEEAMVGHVEMEIVKGPVTSGGNGSKGVTKEASSSLGFRWALLRGRIEALTLSRETDGHSVTVKDLQVTADDIGPGRSGKFDLRGEATVEQLGSAGRWAGSFSVTASIRQDHEGRHIQWNATDDVTIRAWPGRAVVRDGTVISVRQSVTGGFDAADSMVRADSSLVVRYGESLLGEGVLTLRWTESPDGAVTDLGVRIEKVTDQALELMTGGEGAVHLRSSHVGGYVDIHGIGGRYGFRSVLSGLQVQVVSEQGESPPLDIDLAQTGTVDPANHTTTLEIFDVRVADRQRVWLDGELKRALTISLAGDGALREGESASTPAEADWLLTVHELRVEDLHQWFETFGWSGLRDLDGGRLAGTINVSGRENGRVIDLSSRLRVSDLMMASPLPRASRSPVTFDHEARGVVTDLTTLRLISLVITATTKKQLRGTFGVSGALNLKAPASDLELEGSLQLTKLPGEGLNPLLALWTDTRFHRALITGTAHAKLTGALVDWQIDVKGQGVSLRHAKSREATVPLNVELVQTGSLDRITRVLQLGKATVRASEGERPILTATLDKPVHMALAGTHGDSTVPGPKAAHATFGIDVHRMGIEHLKARLALMNMGALEQIRTGFVEAQMTIHWRGEGEPLGIEGAVEVNRLTVEGGPSQIGKPITLKSRIDATVNELSLIEMKEWHVRAFSDAQPIAAARISGSIDLGEGAVDLALKLSTDNLHRAIMLTGFREHRGAHPIVGGAVVAEGGLSRQGLNLPLSLRTTIRAPHLRIGPLKGRLFAYEVLAEGSLEVNAAGSAVHINPTTITVKQGGSAGTVTVSGRWPIGLSREQGLVEILAKHLDCGPVTDLYGLFPGRVHGPLLLNAEVVLTQDQGEDRLTIEGQETVGPIRVSRKDRGQPEAMLRIEHRLLRQRDDFHMNAVHLTAERSQAVRDDVAMSGVVQFGAKPALRIKGEIAALDLGWYAALFSKQAETAGSTAGSLEKNSTEQRAKPWGLRSVFGNYELDLSIGSLSYGKMPVGPGRLIVKGTDRSLEARLEPTGLADGQVEAALRMRSDHETIRLDWSGKGTGLNVEAILLTVEPGEAARMTGRGSFQAAGGGLLTQGQVKRQLAGSGDFKIEGGQFLRMPFFDFLADQTKIQQIRKMGFTEFRSHVKMEEGRLYFENLAANGSVSSVEGDVTIAEDGTVDGLMFVKIGPSFAKSINIPCMSALFVLPDGFTTLPFGVRIKGRPTAGLTYRVDNAAWDQAKGTALTFAGKMKNLARGCRTDS